ncbi:unnamed protein product [Bemisia tabaci]|uniref:Major facilitator superfamily (MFS) profile domain-containing protein n=3 Tax=Bemisia tabaci TaxID=7038 RepID=A0A9P0EW98_BEMTA|nr:unnamed protein product [Bemisia tabaci]
MYLTVGITGAFPTILIPALTAKNTESVLHLTIDQASWFGSANYIFRSVGCLVAGIGPRTWGWRKLIMLASLLQAGCWLLIYLAPSTHTLFISQSLLGIVSGLIESLSSQYMAEICEPSVRGTLLALIALAVTMGYFIVFSLDYVTKWQNIAAINVSLPLLCIVLVTQIPDSPIWLLSQGRPTHALKSLQWLRGWTSAELVQEEFEKMEAHYKKSTEQSLRSKMVGEYEYELCPTTDKMRLGTSEKQWSRKAIFSSAANLYRDVFREEMLRPFLKCLSLFAIVAFSGLPCLTTYMKKMFQDLDLSINSNQSIMLVTCGALVGNCGCALLVHRVNKKPMLEFSLICCAICLVQAALFLMGHMPGSRDSIAYRWSSVVLISAYYLFANLGLLPISRAYFGEILPHRGREVAASVLTSIFSWFMVISVKTFPALTQALRLEGALLIFAAVCVGGVFFSMSLPETEGKHLQDIEAEVTQRVSINGSKPETSKACSC